MKITDEIRHALRAACHAEQGGAAAFAKRIGFTPAQISRYSSGRIVSISDDSWEKLFPNIVTFLPDEYLSRLDVAAQWKLAPENPALREHMKRLEEAGRNFTTKFIEEICEIGVDLKLDLHDRLTCDLLKYWRDMTPAKRYLLLSYAARLTEDELPAVEVEPVKKTTGH